MKHFARLDTIRAAAILWVVVFHVCGACWGWQTEEWPVRLFGQGGLGVSMFFVLSGFLIHYTSANQPTSVFCIRRFGRIYPPYLVALLTFAVLYGSFWTARGRSDVLGHALLIHTFKDTTFFSINGSFWSLAHEVQFYALYPLLLRFRRHLPLLLWASLAARIGIGVWTRTAHITFANDPAIYLMLPRLYFEWLLGMYVADCVLAGRAPKWHPLVGWLALGVAYLTSGRGWLDLATVPAIALATAVWIVRAVECPQESRIDKLLAPLGVISYSLYLWHQPIVNELCKRIMHQPANPVVLLSLAMVVCWLASVLVAIGAYRAIEVPSIELTKQLAKRLARPTMVVFRQAA
ncbi:MAG TPA: acyltransferase [Pirellulaceae bacterium]|jgi:peptidoglycan/LPS O-acetylase OafA/YrhL